ncbi:NucA/NucB deoxyribonuclease domain-containing protein [Streptomyces tanashiensis]|uniref:NucA/NucB deoxyribonuclease domain-containing protein n=1 Tax=Streptomyces tanashiensis TaxID=67367 RepID=UPI0036EC5417
MVPPPAERFGPGKTVRRRTCPTSLPRPKGTQCDDYPFASTTEGGGIIGKTQSRKMTAADHNRQGGTQLATFSHTHRIIPGDLFYSRAV